MSLFTSSAPLSLSIKMSSSLTAENFSTSGNCPTPGCEVALQVVLEDDDILSPELFVCKHTLVKQSKYFEKMFYGEGNFTERDNNKVEIKDITESELVAFLSWVTQHPFKPLPSAASSLCALITLSDRFACPALEKELTKHLATDVLFQATAEDKLKLLEAADKHKGDDGCILEACIRLSANLDIEKLSSLTGKVSVSSLAAAYAMVGRAMTERFQSFLGEMPSHACTTESVARSYASAVSAPSVATARAPVEVRPSIPFPFQFAVTPAPRLQASARYNKISCSFGCGTCDKSQKIEHAPVAFGKIKQIKVEKELFFG